MQIAFEYAKIMCSRRVEYVVQPQLFWGKTFDNWSFSVIEKQGKTEQNKKNISLINESLLFGE